MLDNSKEIQVFNGVNSECKDELVVYNYQKLGSGGQAISYECEIDGIKGPLANKFRRVIKNQKIANEQLIESLSEFLIASKLQHPNIVEHKYFIKKQTDYVAEYSIIMELMKGKDMYSYIKNKKLGPPKDVTIIKSIGSQFLSAIEYLHKKQIVHLDLKPENIVFSEDYSTVKIIDLGVAQKLNMEAKFCSTAENGTDRYKSPEQLKGLLTFKIDIW